MILVLAISVMGAQLPGDALFARIEPAALVIAAFWVAGLWLVNNARKGLPWHDTTGTAPESQEEPHGPFEGHDDEGEEPRARGCDLRRWPRA